MSRTVRASRDLFPLVVHVMLQRSGAQGDQLFLLRRAGTGFMDGYYVLPGGHVQAGESLTQAAARECEEETGVRPASLRAVCVLPYRSGRHQGINVVFEGGDLPGDPGLGEPAHCDRAAWFDRSALPHPVAPWLPEVLEMSARGDWFRELYWP